MRLSGRVRNVRPSGVRKIFDLAAKVKNPINLSIGEPDFDIPDEIKEEGIKWIRAGFNKYTPSGGIPELREKVFPSISIHPPAVFRNSGKRYFVISRIKGLSVMMLLSLQEQQEDYFFHSLLLWTRMTR